MYWYALSTLRKPKSLFLPSQKNEWSVNNKGNANSNMAMDLAIEHCNKFYKDNVTLKDSTQSHAVLNGFSFSQDTSETVWANFNSGFGLGDNVQMKDSICQIWRR